MTVFMFTTYFYQIGSSRFFQEYEMVSFEISPTNKYIILNSFNLGADKRLTNSTGKHGIKGGT